jgi:hypothetical protein
MPSTPTTTDQVTAAYVTAALREGGVIGSDTAVAEVSHDQIGEGVGIVGQLARLTLRYDGVAEGSPSSVIVKMPSQYPENRAIGDHFDFYGREGRFYQQIGDKSALRTPHCFHNRLDPDAGEYLLLLEDFGDRTLISQIAGMPAARAADALDAIALLHAEWWDSPALDALGWVPRLVDPINLSAGAQYRQAWPEFLARWGDALPAGAVALGERVKDRWEDLATVGYSSCAPTLCHGDFRADNLMFEDRTEGRDRVGVLDWQIVMRGPAVSDVTYLISQSVDVDERRESERELLEGWYDALCTARGVGPDGFGMEDVWREYRRGVLAATVYPAVAGGTMDPANDRGRQLVTTICERAFTAALDHDGADLLPG